MRNSQMAERILSLVTPPERAASAVGDLMENAAIGGAFRFWTGVLRTAFSLLWQDLSGEPARMMGLAIRGFLVQFGIFMSIVLFFVVGAGFLGGFLSLVAGSFWRHTNVADGPHPWAYAISMVLSAGVGILVSRIWLPTVAASAMAFPNSKNCVA